MQNLLNYICILCIALGISGCGRKQKNIFVFKDPQTHLTTVSTLSLPVVKQVCVEYDGAQAILNWKPIDINKLPDDVVLLGYHVFRFFHGSFVPSNPVTKKIVKRSKWTDPTALTLLKKGPVAFLVRAYFKQNSNIIQGPISKIVVLKKLPPT